MEPAQALHHAQAPRFDTYQQKIVIKTGAVAEGLFVAADHFFECESGCDAGYSGCIAPNARVEGETFIVSAVACAFG